MNKTKEKNEEAVKEVSKDKKPESTVNQYKKPEVVKHSVVIVDMAYQD